MVVASGSMSYKNEANTYLFTMNLNDQFQQYDIIVLEKVKRNSLREYYDVIAYRNDKGINIIHRIIDIEYGTTTKFVTRGDIYDSSKTDSYKPVFEDIIGRYTGKRIPGIGIFVLFLQSYAGIITVLSLVYCLLMIDRTASKINRVQDERAMKLEEALDYLDETTGENFRAEYKETIYYKGFAYSFDEEGFIEKNPITEGTLLEHSNNSIIKEIKKDDENIATEEVVITEENE
jgi:signal peptidase I